MQTTERPPTGPARGNSPVRGVVLVAVAVVLGFFILRAIDDTGGAPGVPDETAAATGEEAAEGGEAPASTEPAAPQPRPVGEVTVIVANASGVSGAAAQQTDLIAGAGYVTLEGTNAPEQSETTQVLALPGYEADAAALATAINAPPESVAVMPEPPPLDPAGAQILVILGSDLAAG